ncbi:ATP-binding cassette domain-containing protein [Synechococcus sp. AH-229-G18]|nr:ATP-binding cassette domain-containing protein [Synechococcus sp. AH-229-G18]
MSSIHPSSELIRDLTLSPEAPLAFCIRLLLQDLKWKGSINDFSSLLSKDPRKLDIVDTRNLLLSLGYNTKLENYKDVKSVRINLLPALYFTNDGTPYLLNADSDDQIYAASPSGKLTLDAINRNGQLLTLVEASALTKIPLLNLLFYRFSRKISLLYFISFALALLALVLPIYLRSVFNIVIPSQNLLSAAFLLLGAVMLFILDHNLRRWRSTIISQLSGRLDSLIGIKIVKKFLDLDLPQIELMGETGYITRMKSLENIISFLESQLAPAILDFPFVILYLIALGLIAGNLALIPLFLMIISGTIVLLLSRYYAGAQELNIRSGIGIFQAQQELVRRFVQIRLSRLEWVWVQRIRALSAESTATSLSISQQVGRLQILISSSSQMAGILTLSVGAWFVVTQSRSISDGDLIAAMFIVWRIFGSFQSLMSALLRANIVYKQFNQIQTFLSLSQSSKRENLYSDSSMIFGSIKLESVSCRLSGSDFILKKVSFDFPSGSISAVTGKEGSGKTSVLKVIDQLYPISSGKLLFDGIDYRQFSKESIQKSIAYVSSTPHFLPGTLWFNLAISNTDVQVPNVEDVCKRLGILEFITSLPNGFDTYIDQDLASTFPIGIRKMFSLAQALIKPAPILLIDDIGLGLSFDQFDCLCKLLQDINNLAMTNSSRTVIMSTDNNELLKKAEYICILDKGVSVFQGTEKELKIQTL